MKRKFLIAETPRAGPYGHRFILPPGHNLAAHDVETDFQRALQAGSDKYIYVQHQVEQKLPNGSIRVGPETLMISGLHPADLDPLSLQMLQASLNKRLEQLDHMISKEINWEQEGNATIIIRRELQDWWTEDIDKLPAIEAAPQSPLITKQLLSSLVGAILGLACGILILYWFV